MEQCENHVLLSGTLEGSLTYSHSLYGEAFYAGVLAVPRLSGTLDRLPVTVSERLMPHLPMDGDALAVAGQLRSYNKQVDGANRLILTVFVQSLSQEGEARNEIRLTGYLCKQPVFRVTPFAREITDLLVAVNRAFNKSDYVPCIAWGRNARFASALEVGARLSLTGRIQSRPYQKHLEDGTTLERTAYEVSVATLEAL